ncbi:MAG: hypothetical protein HYZ39_03910 [Mycolicibacterium cosmeticum]|nr:hypothetical protein [Mycolicibacterium cosmeticum]
MQLRAPRVALVVPVTADWHLIARNAMHAFTRLWGGAGFVIVPTDGGAVHPAVLAALKEYDPDSVLVPPADAMTRPEHIDAIQRAQETISAVCSNFRAPLLEPDKVAHPACSDLWNIMLSLTDPPETSLSGRTPGSGYPSELPTQIDDEDGWETISAHPGMGGSLGLAAAVRWGLAERPSNVAMDVDPAKIRLATRRLSSGEQDATSLSGLTTRDTFQGKYSTALSRTLFGLDGVQSHGPQRSDALVVFGSSPDDFALAMTWDRTYRFGIWIPDDWWADPTLRAHTSAGIDNLVWDSNAALKKVIFTSTSLDDSDLVARAEEWWDSSSLSTDESRREKWDAITADKLRSSRYWKVHYVLKEHMSTEWSTTVYTSGDTLEFAMLPPLPNIGVRGLESLEKSVCWYADVSIHKHDLPAGRAIPEESLLVQSEETRSTRIRAGRSGVSYQVHRTDLIPTGASLSQSLARPLLRFPSLIDWANARAGAVGMSVRLSSAGTQANVLASMLGGRDVLSDLVASEMRAALVAFNRRRSTRQDYPNGEGCVVDSEGYLRFSGICAFADISPDATARDRVDTLLQAGVIRRGLLTKCPVCHHSAFVHVDDVAAVMRCQRCRADNAFERQLWRLPVDEPTWFYDLHPIARTLLKDNGDVPLLLSEYLRKRSTRTFLDAAEFELVGHSGDPVSETDVLALADRQLVVAEAKSSNTFGGRTERNGAARKRALAAKAFHADEVVLATTEMAWDQATITAMQAALHNETWPTGQCPRLRTICGLGGDTVTDEIVNQV